MPPSHVTRQYFSLSCSDLEVKIAEEILSSQLYYYSTIPLIDICRQWLSLSIRRAICLFVISVNKNIPIYSECWTEMQLLYQRLYNNIYSHDVIKTLNILQTCQILRFKHFMASRKTYFKRITLNPALKHWCEHYKNSKLNILLTPNTLLHCDTFLFDEYYLLSQIWKELIKFEWEHNSIRSRLTRNCYIKFRIKSIQVVQFLSSNRKELTILKWTGFIV